MRRRRWSPRRFLVKYKSEGCQCLYFSLINSLFHIAGNLSHPGLLTLQNDRSDDMQKIRWSLLSHIISPTLDVSVLSSIPHEDCVYPLLALHYLINETERLVLDDWELDAFIAQHFYLKLWSLDRISKIRFPPNVPDPRGVQLATIYMARGLFGRANAAVGYPVAEGRFLNINIFDGKLFQSIYLDFKYGRQKLEAVVSENALGDAPLWLRNTLKRRNT